MRDVALADGPSADLLSTRGARQLSAVQEEYEPVVAREAAVLARDGSGAMRWWTWAGARANGTLGAALQQHGLRVSGIRDHFIGFDEAFGPDDLRVRFDS